jgi:hypothetical protein
MAINDSSDQAALEHHGVNCKLRDTSNDATFHLIWTLLVCLSNVIGYGEHLFQKWPTYLSPLASVHRHRRHNPYPNDRKNTLIPS